ncbi:MAG: PASTA domain-containing protein [Selenomonadaceae bacterium]|nr:PASTA domain-containing protein [Selenomonadaceae bacterium]
MKKNRAFVQSRITKLVLFLLLLIVVIVIRYGWLQLVQGSELSERMRWQVGHDYSVQSPRGAIIDRHGRELAVSTMTKSLFVDPNHVEDAAQLAKDLAPLVDKTEQEILDDIAVGGGFSWVKRRLEQSEYEAIRTLIREKNYAVCLGFRDEAKRYYPNDVLAANVLGFVGTDDKGLDGIEQALDKYIKGEVTESFIYADTRERPILESIFTPSGYQGDRCKTIQLTIDSAIQFIVEQELDRAMAENSPLAITCIAMNPHTGEILAMANRPSYNPNRFWDYDQEVWKNRGVSYIYEPGSTFKAVVAGAALQEGLVSPNQTFVDPGYVMVSGKRIQNWNGLSFGTVTFADVVKQSLNTGFALVGLDLGADKLISYAKLFGFGDLTGIELPGEEAGLLYEPQEMVDSDIATMAIGQSIAVTPLQLITAFCAIANDGILLKPHIVKQIKNANGSIYSETHVEEVRRTIDSATDKTLVGLLEQVVASGGGGKASVRGYRIAGKTGTAQKVSEYGTGYSEGKYIASFCGFAPVENPQIALLVMIDEPYGTFYGGQIAAPVAGRIFSQVFRYMRIEPSDAPLGLDADEISDEVGTGDASIQSFQEHREPTPKEIEPKVETPKQEEQLDPNLSRVPSFQGKSIREAARLANEAGLAFEADGSGFAVDQSIAAGEIVDKGTAIKVHFSP